MYSGLAKKLFFFVLFSPLVALAQLETPLEENPVRHRHLSKNIQLNIGPLTTLLDDEGFNTFADIEMQFRVSQHWVVGLGLRFSEGFFSNPLERVLLLLFQLLL